MLSEILLGVLLVLAGGSGVVLWIRRGAANARVIGGVPPGGVPDRIFRGGIMARHLLTSGTMVRLEFFDWGIRLCGGMLARRVIPTWEARYDDLSIAELVTLPNSRITVWFRLRGEPGAVGFLSNDSREILTLLQAKDVPVNRSITQVRRVEELYR